MSPAAPFKTANPTTVLLYENSQENVQNRNFLETIQFHLSQYTTLPYYRKTTQPALIQTPKYSIQYFIN